MIVRVYIHFTTLFLLFYECNKDQQMAARQLPNYYFLIEFINHCPLLLHDPNHWFKRCKFNYNNADTLLLLGSTLGNKLPNTILFPIFE